MSHPRRMDPTRTLEEIRSLARKARERDRLPGEVVDLLDDLDELDTWIASGKRLPAQWKNRRAGRPPITTDGDLVEGARHGTRNAYNMGCHCRACRAANRGEDPAIIEQLLVDMRNEGVIRA